MDTPKQYDPRFQCWHEKDFQSDPFVSRMKPTQRHMYRALLQAAFNYSTRPYLSADDYELMVLADAESEEQWLANKPVVMRRFEEVEVEGRTLWANKRVTADWEQLMEWYKNKTKGGKALQRKLAAAAQEAALAGKEKPKEKSKKKVKEESELETVTRNQADGFGSGSGQNPFEDVPSEGFSEVRKSTVPVKVLQEIAKTLLTLFENALGKPGKEHDFEELLRNEYENDLEAGSKDIRRMLFWIEDRSDYWRGRITQSSTFRKDFTMIHQQWQAYTEQQRLGAEEKRRVLEESPSANSYLYSDRPSTLPTEPEEEDFGSFEISEEELD